MPNPNQEQKDLLAGLSFVVLEKEVLEVAGQDRLTWLNDMLSQKLDDLKPGQSVEALWLDAQGRVLRDFHIVDDGEKTYLITFSDDFEAFQSSLARMIFRAQVVLKHRTDLKVIATFKAAVPGCLESWQDPWPGVTVGGWRYGVLPVVDWQYFESLVTELPTEFTAVSAASVEALRVAAMRPTGPNEIDERSIPHEYDWLATAVHLDKGCYRGQETVAKVHNLGAPPRRLVFLHLDGSGHLPPEVGDEVIAEDVIGKITSVGNHFEMGPIALAVIKRNTTVKTVSVKLSSGTLISATVEDIVPSDAGGIVDLGDFRKKR